MASAETTTEPLPPASTGDEDDAPLSPPRAPGLTRRRSNSLNNEEDEEGEQDAGGDGSMVTPEEECEQIKALHDFEVQVGAWYYLLESAWWHQWCQYVGFEGDAPSGGRPGPIDNTVLLEQGSGVKLKRSIREQADYVLLVEKEWALFETWYGGGPHISRRGIREGGSYYGNAKTIVELYSLTLKVYRSSAVEDPPIEMCISKEATVREFKEMACKLFGVAGSEVRLWDYFHKKPYALLDTNSKKLGECQIMDNNEMLVEEKDEDGKFTIKKDSDNYSSGYSSYGGGGTSQNVVTANTAPTARGVVGLQNLGNTCFMNSTLQCLSNTPPLRKFFAEGAFESDINTDNPLGHEGKLAESFAGLMQLMWPRDGDPPVSGVAPRAFKYQMGTFRPEFAGYQQHDSSELMNFLLDGLHEDLNRIKNKPYVEQVESNGRPDQEVADESLQKYRLRNDSSIHDLFLGQYKSTLVCPVCANVSITFDPYTMVSLPLRSAKEELQTQYKVRFFRHDPETGLWTRKDLKVGIPKSAAADKLIEAVAEAAEVPIERVVVGQSMRSYIYKFFEDTSTLEYANRGGHSTMYAYEVEYPEAFQYEDRGYRRDPPPDVPKAAITLYFRKLSTNSTSNYYYSRQTDLYGEPLLFCHPKQTCPADLYQAVADLIGKGKVSPDMFNLYVCNASGQVEQDAVPSNDRTPVKNGMKVKLYLALEWEDWAKEQIMDLDGVEGKIGERLGGGMSAGARGAGGGDADDGDEDEDEDEGDMTIHRCLELFSTEEKLSPEDAWYCSKCKNHVEATKKLELWSLPKVLVLHLKRFSYSRYFRDKLETHVTFPLDNLDMSTYVRQPAKADTPPAVYNCVGVSNHMGSLGGGHYTACGRSSEDGRWYKFNDSHTSPMNPSAVNSRDAYLLFYVRKDVAEAEGLETRDTESPGAAEEG